MGSCSTSHLLSTLDRICMVLFEHKDERYCSETTLSHLQVKVQQTLNKYCSHSCCTPSGVTRHTPESAHHVNRTTRDRRRQEGWWASSDSKCIPVRPPRNQYDVPPHTWFQSNKWRDGFLIPMFHNVANISRSRDKCLLVVIWKGSWN